MPLVSAAIITYNRAHYLDDAIASVLGQTFDDFELIVVDDGSTDDTQAVVARYGGRVRYVRCEHGGKAAARNTAAALAQGQFLAFCDSDDLWYPDRLARQVRVLRADPRIGMVHGHVDVIDADGHPLPERTAAGRAVFGAAHRKRATYASYAFDCRCLSSTVLLRREVFDAIGLYDCDLPIEDYDFYLRLVLAYEIAFLHGPALAMYRAHDEATDDRVLGSGQIKTAEKHLAMLDARTDIPDARRAKANFNLMIAQTWRALGDRRRGRPAALRALSLGAPKALRLAL